MDADLDTLCTVVYCTADDLLPEARANARRRVTDAELVTLCVAQAIMGIPSDRRFLAVARKRLVHLFPDLPGQSAYFKRRRRLADAIEWLMGVFASRKPGLCRRPAALRLDAGRVRPQPGDRPALGAWRGRRLRLLRGSLALLLGPASARRSSPSMVRRGRSSSPTLPVMSARSPSSCLRAPCAAASCCSATRATPAGPSPRAPRHSASPWCVPSAATSAAGEPHLAPIRQRIESIFWTAKDLLTLERHGARTMAGLRERVLQRFLCLAACISLNHRLGTAEPLSGQLLRLRPWAWNQSSRPPARETNSRASRARSIHGTSASKPTVTHSRMSLPPPGS